MTAKLYKLWIHHKHFTDKQADEILINVKEFSQVTVGDVLEIYHPEEEYSRLLLQIKTLTDDFQQKDTVSIEKAIANAFQLKAYKDVYVNKVDTKSVTLDLVELLFKDQYFSRSDMNRMRNSMKNSCVYLNKKVEFSESRAQVNELWSKGERVTCGVISEDTRIVFRSSTAVVQIFIQMSTEMWDFDLNGDLYFEKAINGFLTDLFAKWKQQNCCHDVTIVMFSRTFYDAQSRDELPPYMQECLQQDYKGRFYEDFYRIVIQNERYDDWTGTVKQLRKYFNEYPKHVLHYHRHPSYKVPKGRNSSAVQGNFLETLNMSLNLFEKYYMDRNFDRTGKVAVVITPGAGVFEVDRELTNITKQRTIDCGVGSDLVCMGEQPLHAAPLFKFHSKNVINSLEVGDDYNIPHWMNHSFYTSKNQVQFCANKNFVPRIKVPPEVFETKKQKDQICDQELSYGQDEDNFPFVDYDEYDAQVFKLPTRHTPQFGLGRAGLHRDTKDMKRQHGQTFIDAKLYHMPRTRHISDDILISPIEKTVDRGISILSSSPAISIPSRSSSGEDLSSSLGCYPILENVAHNKNISRETTCPSDSDNYLGYRPVVGSAGSPVGHRKRLSSYKRHRALINPFAPSRMQFKMTSNRRRWIHAFPTDPYGAAVQTHHVHNYSYHDTEDEGDSPSPTPTREVIEAAQIAARVRKKRSNSRRDDTEMDELANGAGIKGISPVHAANHQFVHSVSHDSATATGRGGGFGSWEKQRDRQQRSWLWGPTGEQEWSPELTTGQDWRPLDQTETCQSESRLIKPILTADIDNTHNFCAGISVDWKSLTIPASLPITTDYFPDPISLNNDYVVSDYSLLPDEVNSDYYLNPPVTEDDQYYRQTPLSTQQVFKELISQRLAQGFQLINVCRAAQPPLIVSSVSVVSQRSIPGSSPQVSHMQGLIRARPREEQSEEVYLSIGRIFHKLTLTGPTITVTRYRPRHPNPPMCYSYRYRFQAPDSYQYDVSWSMFCNEKLENYNWNYLDQYICTRGEGDYGLMDSLKFWRSRFYILPCNNPATKKIIENIDSHPRWGILQIQMRRLVMSRLIWIYSVGICSAYRPVGLKGCDIYEEKTVQELKQLVSGFTRYVETLNKIRRSQTTRELKCKHVQPAPGNQDTAAKEGENEEALSSLSLSEKIVDAMLDSGCGMPMLPKQRGLPQQCFISAEVADWCFQHIAGVNTVPQAMDLLQRLLDDGLIIHASGNTNHKIIYGFYLYTFVSQDKAKTEPSSTSSNNPMFQNDWCEVAILPPKEEPTGGAEEGDPGTRAVTFNLEHSPQSGPDAWLSTSLEDWQIQTGHDGSGMTWAQHSATMLHKYVNVEVDSLTKSDRPEWATARYHAYYSPLCGFELQIQWMVSTGGILGDLVNNWARKAGACSFHIMPVPVDPFALPTSPDSDPLRGPIFVPLYISKLAPDGELFKDFDDETRTHKLLHFQETIIKRFGFMPASVRIPSKGMFPFAQYEEYQQYVHCTGGMYVLIEHNHNGASPIVRESRSRSLGSFTKKSSSELRKDYIARQTSQTMSQTQWQAENRVGFLWSWNFMSSKRWRSGNTGDEHFQDTVLSDFRAFCTNDEHRLCEFWDDYSSRYAVLG